MTGAMAEVTPRVSLDSVRAAASALEGVALRTPLIEAPALSRGLGASVRLKCEHLQPVGAFKIRGAYTALSRLSPADRARGVVTHSSGNHGQAVAYAARLLGIPAVIVMPASAPKVKVDGVRGYGGEVVFVQHNAEREPRAGQIAAERGMVPVPPYEHVDVIAGQATVGLEILQQWPEVSTIMAPVGGGGLLAGIATAVAAMQPSVRVIGVEPAAIPKLSAAIRAGHPAPVDRAQSLADGLLPPSVGRLPWAQIAPVVREAVAVSDPELARAVKFLFYEMGLRVEPSGAATVAAVLAGLVRASGPTALVLSGGNMDPDVFLGLVR
jgi:threonine dehydratase